MIESHQFGGVSFNVNCNVHNDLISLFLVMTFSLLIQTKSPNKGVLIRTLKIDKDVVI